MSKDYRMDFIRNVESALARKYDPDEIAQISNIVIKALSEYEIAERCTDLVQQDDINEKLIRRYTACLLVDGKSKNTVKQYARTFATNLARRGMEVQEIQKLLGHSNINTTMIYVSTDDTKVRASYSRYTA